MTTTDLTIDSSATDDLVRPQPLGVFDGPAGLLLLPAADGAAELASELAAGSVPTEWPAAGALFAAALADDTAAALATLGTTPVDAVNRLVLSPTPEHWTAAMAAADGDVRLGAVVAAAAYAAGLSDDPPSVDGLDEEFAVLALTVRAARAMEFTDAPGALRTLRDAVPFAAAVGPALEGRIVGMIADHRFRTQNAVEASLEHYDRAISLLERTDLDQQRAEWLVERGVALHQLSDVQPHRLVEAIRSYQSALVVLDETDDPERFALANMNIGIAILALPMTQASDQVKLGVAVQSLRAALRVYGRDSHPYEWASCQMNLANALQYLPSTHREDNLREAVDLYEEVLQVRSRLSDPVGFARVLANQANALAHLAAFDDAEERYRDARSLFAGAGEADATEVIDRQLQQIAEQREALA